MDTDWFNEHFTGRRHVELIRTKSYNPISANGREVFPFTMSVAYHPLHIQQNTSNKYLSFDIISNIKIYADVFEHSENSWSTFCLVRARQIYATQRILNVIQSNLITLFLRYTYIKIHNSFAYYIRDIFHLNKQNISVNVMQSKGFSLKLNIDGACLLITFLSESIQWHLDKCHRFWIWTTFLYDESAHSRLLN